MRVFIGIPIPEEIRNKIKEIEKEFKIKGIKIVEPENLHWTVKFLGELNDNELEKTKSIMDGLNFNPVKIEVRGINVFPNLSYIRTIWIGVGEGLKKFKDELEKVNNKFSGIGKKNSNEIIPHLTIGRVKFLSDKEKLIKLMKKYEEIKIGEMITTPLVLYESILTPKGPIYKKLKVKE
ncbi:MAG: RNA 2',3'-cyclic phosphodiesterase [Candidatus Aenigmarchaeota archaeon]|nr:RNA 2',3'-cyclic phosphodiesterase [Candidatus Aenigmarchaeota archaeon]